MLRSTRRRFRVSPRPRRRATARSQLVWRRAWIRADGAIRAPGDCGMARREATARRERTLRRALSVGSERAPITRNVVRREQHRAGRSATRERDGGCESTSSESPLRIGPSRRSAWLDSQHPRSEGEEVCTHRVRRGLSQAFSERARYRRTKGSIEARAASSMARSTPVIRRSSIWTWVKVECARGRSCLRRSF